MAPFMILTCCYVVYFFIIRALINLQTQTLTSINKLIKENETTKYVSQEFYDIFHALQVGILLITNGKLIFSNY
jgi:hypothetical protein